MTALSEGNRGVPEGRGSRPEHFGDRGQFRRRRFGRFHAFAIRRPFSTTLPASTVEHQWSSGRMHRYRRCDPGSIPGWFIE